MQLYMLSESMTSTFYCVGVYARKTVTSKQAYRQFQFFNYPRLKTIHKYKRGPLDYS